MIRDDASLAQVRAADPQRSTWLSANAGSGKTRVLTDRVARMLISGVDPGRILCLTYTKAAASEMQNRLFGRLGEWAMKPDTDLRKDLADLGVEGIIDAPRLALARQLFARAIETPGGLRIQTIHSFCASLLRRFPLEAGVSPQFTEMDDRAAALLRDQILDEMAQTLAPDAVNALAMAYTGEDFGALADEVARKRNGFARFLTDADARALFEVPEALTQSAIIDQVFLGGEDEWLADATAIIATGSTMDVKAAAKFKQIELMHPDLATLQDLESILLTGAGAKLPFTAKIGSFPTKATQTKLGALQNRLEDLMGRVEVARPLRVALVAAQRTATLHAFAAVFLPEYAARKSARGLLDFDDLITRAKTLLTDPAVAQWVLFRLDGGIDHILVDEAQDTSPDQWRVIELLAAEFTTGRGARDDTRTIFVVGDKKQSIYSFQGAKVEAFDEKRALFAGRLDAAQTPLQTLDLLHSFRSSPVLLDLVDLTFDERRAAGLGGEVKHIAFNPDMPGRVDLWPHFEKSSAPEEKAWFDPLDLITEEHHAAKLANRIAQTIQTIIESGTQIPTKDGPRPVHPGDFLILVRRRSDIFAEIIRACKSLKLPIAGADRLKLGAEMAVRDLASLLSFLATPEDDLSLAEILKSPLFGWTEQQLFSLAQGRKGFLWTALRNDENHPETRATLLDLLAQADYLRPYDLIERVLIRHDGRRKLIARLGAEAEDGIDELLSQALSFERSDVPSLTGFLGWLKADDIDVKRQMDSAGHKIRVMTVHGAKGLEAPIVILPDTAVRQNRERDELFDHPQGPLWKTPSAESPDLIAQARADRKAMEEAESLRLLYVAMTRAQSWLIVGSAGTLGNDSADDEGPTTVWYKQIREGMVATGALPTSEGGLILAKGIWPSPIKVDDGPQLGTAPTLPDWAKTEAPAAPRDPPPINPSQMGGAKALPGESLPPDQAMARGTALHLLLEHLPNHPKPDWPALARSLTDDEALLAEATAVLTAPHLARLFGSDSLAEVPITAVLDGQPMLGTIDRLVITPDKILAVDYKSNTVIPVRPQDTPDGLLRQLQAYSEALAQIYPDRTIETAILWTRTAQLMAFHPDIVRGVTPQTPIP